MITDKNVQELLHKGQLHIKLKGYWRSDSLPKQPPQFWRGVATRFLNDRTAIDSSTHKPIFDCRRHISVFNKHKIIPEYCFDCFKIVIKPRTVIELFKLMILFEKANNLGLSKDNTRKCMVEYRPEAQGTYKGFIYFRNLKETKIHFKRIKKIISTEISKKIPVFIKRGCTELSQIYPEFEVIGKDGKPKMAYKKEWRKTDELEYENMLGSDFEPPPDTYNHFGYDLNDGLAMVTWIKYAATIGDPSYVKITPWPIPKFLNLTRPLFQTGK